MARGRHLERTAGALAIIVAAAGFVAVGGSAQATGPKDEDKVRPELAAQMAARGGGDFWIRFGGKADLSAASKIKDWSERGTAVAAALKKVAAGSQGAVKAELDRDGTAYESFWATNAIKVSGGSAGLVQKLAARAEVEGLYAPVSVEVPKVSEGVAKKAVNAVEWGIANINADKVWDQYGVTGEGITVASIDTGVQFDHPQLVGSYRGNNGDGTFTHDYNWYDAAGSCGGGAPCDTNGHGTHTMGTMAGATDIGVAPGVRWIAANGCCPSDTALINSGQWLLEPTDHTGANPDAGKRPNIINNSWGTTQPSFDPFFDDITNAWAASGIFGVWSNGNNGSGCQSSGSPGSLPGNYSVGAYDASDVIADFSSRGAGQNGDIKPNIAAPGVNVRSSWPGGGYNTISGTSMAAPHLVGAIALLWSGAPALAGDIAGTKALLDDTATDTEASQCGGTADDNNVFGEGRLDVLKLLAAAPIGDTGTLAGKVTDAATGAPITNATLALTGAAARQVVTGTDGAYSTRLPAGDYQVAVTAYGFGSKNVTATVAADQTVALDVALTAVPTVTVGGTVTDGSGHGWPLYAKVTVGGAGGVSDYTTPTNGRYSLKLPTGATYKLTFASQYPGYAPVTKDVVVGTKNVTQNVAVPASADDCTAAPGYEFASDGEYQTFDTTAAPTGWTVADHAGNGQVWKFTDDGNRGNNTGGAGPFAIIDSDHYGAGGKQNTSLVSPVVDLSGVTAPVIRFDQEFRQYATERTDVELSVDGGTTWETVLSQTTGVTPSKTEIAIPQAAGKSQVRVRFHYVDGSYAWWWQVDNVLIGSEVRCDPIDSGLVVGHVKDGNTGGYVNGATVTSKDAPAEKATTAATPDDTGLADGFFWMLSTKTGSHSFDAKAAGYAGGSATVDVEADWVSSASFELGAGRLEVAPASLSADLRMPDGTATKKFTVTNTGTQPVAVEFGERDKGFELLKADGSRMTREAVLQSPGAPAQRLSVATSFSAKPSGKTATAATAQDGPQAEPWTTIAEYPAKVMDNRVVSLEGKVYSIGGTDGTAATKQNYVYDPVAQAWSAIADLPEARSAMTVAAIDGHIIATGGWGASGTEAATWSYDPGANAWTRKADNPAPRSAAGQAVADSKLYAVGGCTTSGCLPMSNSVVRYDASADTWETLANYPKSLAFASCGGIDGTVYCSGGNDGNASQKASYAFDPAAGTWSPIADAPSDHWAASFAVANGKLLVVGGSQANAVTNAGFAYDPAAGAWAALPNANTARYRGAAACGFYKVGGSSGGFTATTSSEALPGLEECAEGGDVSWMTIDKPSVTLAPGKKVTVTVGFTAAVDQPGTYSGLVALKENTPYTVVPVDVTLNAAPPKTWAKLMGTVTGAACAGGTSAPLAGATVQVDSWASSYTFATDAQGEYAYWLDKRNNPLTLIAAKDGWKPQARTSKVNPAAPKVEDFALLPVRC
ncbi:S8 family serine peptidase [Paractinoplanes atraurantiacus]|uniref:Serine protease, subtilisin family n=1 Tax=Paractinoplanes atraurantiacus TaxID=1036182 RepID=A0A285K9Y0_9ACTN|nr:S8 family serine peptidase [Actinoplanes atraurantiacus]SNY69434.1 Serine protease, subtilisin family [Actinoplanes atraurantiacus]